MIVALPFCHKDEHLALLNLELGLKLDEGKVPFRCIVTVDTATDPMPVVEAAQRYFSGVDIFRYPKWTGNPAWPTPQNHAWQQTARRMAQQKDCWLWWEADATPLKKGWLDALAKAYIDGQKPFAGFWVENNNGNPGYMNGVGIYPPNIPTFCVEAMLTRSASFDIVLSSRVGRQCHHLNAIIGHSLKPVAVRTLSEFETVVHPDYVLFHNCKDRSLGLLLLGRIHEATSIVTPDSQLTVVITACRRPDLLWNAFVSCMAAGIQHVVISASGVNDDMKQVFLKIAQRKPDVVIDEIPGDLGCNEMWLRGVRRVQTKWVHILHDDDVLLPSFEKVESFLHHNLAFIHFGADRVGIKGTQLNGSLRSLPNANSSEVSTDLLYPVLVNGTYSISPVSAVWHTDHVKSVLEECEEIAGDFLLRENMMVGNDLLIWLRALDKYYTFYWINESLIAYGSWEGSCTFDDITHNRGRLAPIYSKMRQYWFEHPTCKIAGTGPPLPAVNRSNPKLEPRLIHAVERHTYARTEARRRVLTASHSWEYLYNHQLLVPMHYSHYWRTSKEIGDNRELPYWKDVVAYAMSAANIQDIILFTNDDTILHPDTPGIVREILKNCDAAYSHRCEYRSSQPPILDQKAPLFRSIAIKSIGRDLFAFKVSWLLEHWHEIPDFLIGAPAWDIVVAGLIRITQGAREIKRGKWDQCWEFELPSGYVAHIWHDPVWNEDKIQKESRANAYNNALARQTMTRFYRGHSWSELWAL